MPSVIKVEQHKKGRRRYGLFIWQDNGINFYVAFRKHGDIYASEKGKISDAIRENAAGWAIDMTTVLSARARKCQYLVVKIKGQELMYVTRLENYFNRKLFKTINYSGSGGSLQRCLSLRHFIVHNPHISL